ncbi:hypothetical protein KL941_005436, partial [Ogataea angusta]
AVAWVPRIWHNAWISDCVRFLYPQKRVLNVPMEVPVRCHGCDYDIFWHFVHHPYPRYSRQGVVSEQ